jgi:hypothetical protein
LVSDPVAESSVAMIEPWMSGISADRVAAATLVWFRIVFAPSP